MRRYITISITGILFLLAGSDKPSLAQVKSCSASQKISYFSISDEYTQVISQITDLKKEISQKESVNKDLLATGMSGSKDYLENKQTISADNNQISSLTSKASKLKKSLVKITSTCRIDASTASPGIHCKNSELAMIKSLLNQIANVESRITSSYLAMIDANDRANSGVGSRSEIDTLRSVVNESQYEEVALIEKYNSLVTSCPNDGYSSRERINLASLNPNQHTYELLNDISYLMNSQKGGTRITYDSGVLRSACKKGWDQTYANWKLPYVPTKGRFFIIPTNSDDYEYIANLSSDTTVPANWKTPYQIVNYNLSAWKRSFSFKAVAITTVSVPTDICDMEFKPYLSIKDEIASDIKGVGVVMEINGALIFLGGTQVVPDSVPLNFTFDKNSNLAVCGIGVIKGYKGSSHDFMRIYSPKRQLIAESQGAFDITLTIDELKAWAGQKLSCEVTIDTDLGLATGKQTLAIS